MRWVMENHRPFNIVSDEWFLMLMKTGHPTHYIPLPATVSRDVKNVFIRCCERIAKMLQEYDGELNFATDAWTLPNNKALIAISVHFELKGEPASMLLDLVEVARSHSGINLAEAFSDVLHEFGIENKVSFNVMICTQCLIVIYRCSVSAATMPATWTRLQMSFQHLSLLLLVRLPAHDALHILSIFLPRHFSASLMCPRRMLTTRLTMLRGSFDSLLVILKQRNKWLRALMRQRVMTKMAGWTIAKR